MPLRRGLTGARGLAGSCGSTTNWRTTLPSAAPAKRVPLALLASDQEWSSRSFETILGPSGYAVIHAYTGRETLDRVRRDRPDIILLDAHLPDQDGLELCSALREDTHLDPGTPILMLVVGPATRQQRLTALRAGAWEVLSLPVDAEELLLKLGTYARARAEADRAREEGLIDQLTGLYNARGLARRVREIGSEARRHEAALACVVFGSDPGRETADGEADLAQDMAHVLRHTGRVSDAIGRLGRTDFAIVAPDTNAPAALRLAERMLDAVNHAPHPGRQPRLPVRVGYEVVENLQTTPVEPVDVLVRATTALEHARAEANGERIRRYEPDASMD